MTQDFSDTIFALASAAGVAGVSVMRISGQGALAVYSELCKDTETPKARTAYYRGFYDPKTGDLIDRGVVTYFKAPKSYTGEDTLELTVHGSPAVISKMNDVLSCFKTVRMAEAGEFTQRAFMNGKLDLTAAEGVNDLIYAETEAQRQLALAQLGGSLEGLYHDWASQLTKLLAHQEAEIEFPDEDMPEGIDDSVRVQVEGLMVDILKHLDDNNRGERMRQGMQVAIIGAPNVGKSSLLNLIAGREAAIVSDMAGTTRDVVEVALNLGGYPVLLCDTAGIRADHTDKVEAEGIKRAIKRSEDADLKIALLDATKAPDFASSTLDLIDDNDKTCVVLNKIDQNSVDYRNAFKVSCETKEGIDTLIEALSEKAKDFFEKGGSAPVLTRARHRENLKTCYDSLNRALNVDLPELAAEDLRQALNSIGRITGRVDVEELLDVVFRDFCIGK